jgi:hypothetical protein
MRLALRSSIQSSIESALGCVDASCSAPLWGTALAVMERAACDALGGAAMGSTPMPVTVTDEADSSGARVCAKAAREREAHALHSRPRCTRCQPRTAGLSGESGERARAGVDARGGGGQHGGLPGEDEAGCAAAVCADHPRARPRSRSRRAGPPRPGGRAGARRRPKAARWPSRAPWRPPAPARPWSMACLGVTLQLEYQRSRKARPPPSCPCAACPPRRRPGQHRRGASRGEVLDAAREQSPNPRPQTVTRRRGRRRRWRRPRAWRC